MRGTFADCKVGDLHQVKGKLNQTDYHRILRIHVVSSGTRRLVGQRFVLIQNNHLKNSSKLCQSYIKSKEKKHVPGLIHLILDSDIIMLSAKQDDVKYHFFNLGMTRPETKLLSTELLANTPHTRNFGLVIYILFNGCMTLGHLVLFLMTVWT